MNYQYNELIVEAYSLIDRFDKIGDDMKRKNSLMILAEKFKKLEAHCVHLTRRSDEVK